jgi:hypothetical protein
MMSYHHNVDYCHVTGIISLSNFYEKDTIELLNDVIVIPVSVVITVPVPIFMVLITKKSTVVGSNPDS